MSVDESRTIARRFLEAFAGSAEDFDRAIDDLASPDFRAHLPGAPGPVDRDGWKAYSRPFFTAFSERQFTFEDIIAEGGQVVARGVLRATHTSEFQGIPATGKQIELHGIVMFRVANGSLAEHWGLFDALGLLQQLGAIPQPE